MATKIEMLKLKQFKLAILLGTDSQEYLQIMHEIEKEIKKEIKGEIENERSIR
jgi:hypothetical protein